jgi:hypothetical protein
LYEREKFVILGLPLFQRKEYFIILDFVYNVHTKHYLIPSVIGAVPLATRTTQDEFNLELTC